MTPRKPRANGRAGLFWTEPDNPLLRDCPACRAPARQRCTSPSRQRGGRRNLKGYHDARLNPVPIDRGDPS